MVLVANFLFAFGVAGIKQFDKYKDINNMDAHKVEVYYMNDPENIYLAGLLQSHVILKWSENLK